MSLLARVRSYAAESLVKNSAFLMINLGVTTISGYGSLTLLAHFYSVTAVGLSAAAVSAGALIVQITLAGVNYSLPRFLPTTNNRKALINTLHTGVMIATAIGCVIFLATPFADKMFALGGGPLFSVVFVVSTCMQAGSMVLLLVLIADRKSGKMARANIIPNVMKLGAPPLFKGLGNVGAFISRMFYNLISYFILARIVGQNGHRFKPELSKEAMRELGRFSVSMSVANIIGGLPMMVLPVIVLSRLGAAQSAYWSIAITIGSMLNSLPSMVTQALLPEITHRPAERRHLLIRSTYLVAGLAIPVLILLYLLSPFLIGVMGGAYSAGTLATLHWLIFAAFITMLNYASGAILFLAKKTTEMIFINIVNAIILLGLAGTWAASAQEVAMSWFIGDIWNTTTFGLFAFLALREVGYHFEDLGGREVSSATEQVRLRAIPDSIREALDLLASLAEQQRSAHDHQPDLDFKDSRELYTVLALQEAEQQWYERRAAQGSFKETRLDLYGSAGRERRVGRQHSHGDKGSHGNRHRGNRSYPGGDDWSR